ncbi:cytochrome c biogenesis protein ResB [Ramlibacter sp. G-1-2-2]|uniref:Cytochrome c biogenesis protein ResB n=1 Tax=Ramlibacter agri TaxID=2728837 RepID=A0A848HE87_9BURK|nr:cytochrome c biogenesis protein ResB [Ramlibacter agri]NML47671.1 cytochrome c biogenesis protein ResB [Ramlibacter agri]
MNASLPLQSDERGSPRARALLELLSSMRFAITLLAVICIAMVIGTVLKQQEPVGNYVNQFGPFWAQLFLAIRLNAVYGSWWFLLILAFLVVSTSLCIARNTPKIFQDLRTLKESIREQSLLAFHHRAEGALPQGPEQAAREIGAALAKSGWKVRLQQRGESGWMVAAKTGSFNKIGYLCAHSAIVLACLGGLLDGDLVVRAQMLLRGKTPYTGGGMVSDVPEQHRLPSTNPTFRGNLLVSEGTQSSTAILNQSDGIVLQELPFSIELKKFIVDFYSTGMPKLFASDIVIHDRETGEAIPARVEVNHPAHWRGVDIFQSSFDDGGSAVTLKAVPLDGSGKTFTVQGTIGNSTELAKGQQVGAEKMTLEYTGLRVFNVENLSGPGEGTDPRKVDLKSSLDARLGAANKTATRKNLRNVGPSINYKLRDASGQAREYHNYMLPMDLGDGVPVFVLGVRDSADAGFRYLRVPADGQGTMDDFFRLRGALNDAKLREAAVQSYAKQATDPAKAQLREQLAASTGRALALFAGAETGPGRAAGGLQAVSEFLESNVAETERARAGEVLVRILNGALFELEQQARARDGLAPLSRDDKTQAFMTQAVLALSDVFAYPAPVAFELQDFKQVQASVFQVTRSPGHLIVYAAFALLILGVFAMLYVRERRLWVWLAPSGTGSQARMALSSNRKLLEVDREFDRLKERILGIKP